MAEQKQSYTKHWARKIKTVFRQLDLDNDGYLTEEDLNHSLNHRLEAYPSLDAEEQRQQMHRVWIEFYNGGQQVTRQPSTIQSRVSSEHVDGSKDTSVQPASK